MRHNRYLTVMILVLMPAACRAGIIASEQFEYGPMGGSLAGKNGGTGFSGGWADDMLPSTNPEVSWRYTPDGLSFGSLATAGGAATWSNPTLFDPGIGIASRPFSEPVGGSLFGSFLFRVDDRFSDPSVSNTAALLLGQPSDTDNSASFAMNAPQFGQSVAAQRLEGVGNDFAGESLVVGETYLALFALDAGAAIARGWVLNLGQYEHFVASGLTESDLDAAALGGGTMQVFERGSFASSISPDPLSHLLLFGAFGQLSVTMDEIRLSDSSLIDAAPQVPEPSSLAMAAIGAAGLAVAIGRGLARRADRETGLVASHRDRDV